MKHVIFERMVELLRNVGVLEEEQDLERFAESELEIRADDPCLVAMAKLLFPRERVVFYDAEFPGLCTF